MLRHTQEMRLTQKLDFRMIQSLKLLPLTTMQLEQRIHEELEQNPMLQIDEPEDQEQEQFDSGHSESGQVKTDSSEKEPERNDFTEADWLNYIENGFDSDSSEHDEYDPNIEEREPTTTYFNTLSEHLINQLGMSVRNERDREIGEYIIGLINDDGYLIMKDEDIAAELQIDKNDVSRIIDIIQQFEPIGVAAHDLRECLLLQLKEKEMEGTVPWNIVHDHFSDFTNRKYHLIMKNLSISQETLKEAIETISSLNPRPGSAFSRSSNTDIIPDLVVEKNDGMYEVTLTDWRLPRLTISPNYRRLLERNSGTSTETREYLVNKLNGARWFINSIEQRRSTILRVAKTIVEMQSDFLEHGISHLRPMTLQDVAERVSVSISTVQRVTIGKYIQTPQGVFELKYFFTQRIASTDHTQDFSSKTVKDKMKALIDEEEPQKPLSDQKITDILVRQGIAISRRAIAKYRDELGISPAHLRKKL